MPFLFHPTRIHTISFTCLYTGDYRFESQCYSFNDEEKTWTEARDACAETNMALASIESHDEHDWVRNKVWHVIGRGSHVLMYRTLEYSFYKNINKTTEMEIKAISIILKDLY